MEGRQITSEEFAELIADALIDAGIISNENFDKASEIISEEITVRKAMGDY